MILLEAWLGQCRQNLRQAVISGVGGALAIACLAQAASALSITLLIPPFGATSVLLFALPSSPLARPYNVIGGHALSALVGLIELPLLGDGVLACAMGVGLAIFLMQLTGSLHPPAGATPLVVILTGAGWPFLLFPILSGTVMLVVLAWFYRRRLCGKTRPT